jgi:hypothetical protein
MTGSPRSAHASASSAVNTALPTAAPGEAFRPLAIGSLAASDAITFLNSSSRRLASSRSTAMSTSIRPSSSMS